MNDKTILDAQHRRCLNSEAKHKAFKRLRLKTKGLTVGDLVHKLSYFKKDMKVILTDVDGHAYPAIQVVQDTNRSVLIF